METFWRKSFRLHSFSDENFRENWLFSQGMMWNIRIFGEFTSNNEDTEKAWRSQQACWFDNNQAVCGCERVCQWCALRSLILLWANTCRLVGFRNEPTAIDAFFFLTSIVRLIVVVTQHHNDGGQCRECAVYSTFMCNSCTINVGYMSVLFLSPIQRTVSVCVVRKQRLRARQSVRVIMKRAVSYHKAINMQL